MSKFIIEVPVDAQYIMINGVRMGDCYTQTTHIEDIEELNSDYINENFGELQDEAYQRGFEDGKAVHEKGCEGCKYANVAGTHEPCVRCSNSYGNQWTAKDDKIEVGDEVIYNGTTKCIVVRPEDDERYASLIDSDGTHYSADHRECKKTGRHFDIDKILEEMRHD